MSHGRAAAWRVIVAAGIAAGLVIALWRDTRPPAQFGWQPNPKGVQTFLAELEQPLFSQAGAEAITEAKGVDTFLYRPMMRAHLARYGQPWRCIRQGIGDCVSMGWGEHGAYIALCVDWETGRIPTPPLRVCSESCYGGSRVEARNRREGTGGFSDGSYGGAAARWLRDWGVIFRESIGGHDLTEYQAARAKLWGNWGNGGEGDGGRLDEIAKRHPAKYVSLITTWRECSAALESGFPVVVCSMAGFSSKTDEEGWAVPSGRSSTRWAHCLCLVAVRYQKNGSVRDGALALNSWGAWNSGGRWPADMPEGSFWIDADTVQQMLSAGDSFAIGSVAGFGYRDLHHGNWFQPAPAEGVLAHGD